MVRGGLYLSGSGIASRTPHAASTTLGPWMCFRSVRYGEVVAKYTIHDGTTPLGRGFGINHHRRVPARQPGLSTVFPEGPRSDVVVDGQRNEHWES